tara:strand:+ start:585 stop:764 length:180 start_codon:yes stop_codon:yes gene_type:complete
MKIFYLGFTFFFLLLGCGSGSNAQVNSFSSEIPATGISERIDPKGNIFEEIIFDETTLD